MPDDKQQEDQPFVKRIGPVDVDWARSLGFYGGIALAVGLELIAPELALFVAAVPLVKLFKRKNATKIEKAFAGIVEGAAKPLGGDAEEAVRPAWVDDEKEKPQKKGAKGAKSAHR